MFKEGHLASVSRPQRFTTFLVGLGRLPLFSGDNKMVRRLSRKLRFKSARPPNRPVLHLAEKFWAICKRCLLKNSRFAKNVPNLNRKWNKAYENVGREVVKALIKNVKKKVRNFYIKQTKFENIHILWINWIELNKKLDKRTIQLFSIENFFCKIFFLGILYTLRPKDKIGQFIN